MPDLLTITINGVLVCVSPGTTVAAAICNAGQSSRISVSGEPRAPLCGMGTCFECRAIVDGVSHGRTCQMLCQPGTAVETQS